MSYCVSNGMMKSRANDSGRTTLARPSGETSIGQAQLRRGQDELRGSRISYNAETAFYRVSGQADAQTPAGRVRAVIRPRPKTEQPAP